MHIYDTDSELEFSYRTAAGWAALGGAALLLYSGARQPRARLLLALAAAPLAYRGITGHWPIALPQRHDTRRALSGSRGVHVRESVRIGRPVHEVYRFWRRLGNLSRFLSHLESVTELGTGRSHWVARGPAGLCVEWEAEIINEVENKVIGWRSLPGSDVVVAGSVNFAPHEDGRSTGVTVHLQYEPPAGRAGAAVASLFGREPSQMIRDDLRRLKELLEAREVAEPVSSMPHAAE
jgi:uncharacterized membrane protein